jgi:hypothetical protein
MTVEGAVSEGKIVRIDEFKAERRVGSQTDPVDGGARVLSCGPAVEPRALTPQEISHRFAMLAFLRKAR